jgi:ribose/xylose/arabinose/galactoside ABC-type transport system permease subunit
VILLFAISGFFAALAGLVLTSRVGTSTEGLATNYELAAITAAVLGGANIFGGQGSIVGTVLAVFIIGLLQVGMSLANIEADIQTIAVGLLLILSILIPGMFQRLRAAMARRKGGVA